MKGLVREKNYRGRISRGRLLLLSFLLFGAKLWSVPPVLNYAGQVAVNGEAFNGNGLFKFALVNTDGNVTYWSNDGNSVAGLEPQASVAVSVNGGLYSILLGNTAHQGMGAINPQVFSQHADAKLRVWFSDGLNGFQQLSPDRPFASVPYAFSAGTAQSAFIADGSINKSMLGGDVIADLNATIGVNRLSAEVAEKLDRNTTTNNYNAPSVGSLLAVPYGSTAPAGYSLYQSGEPKKLIWAEKAPLSEGRGIFDGIDVIDGKIYASGSGGTVERYSILTNTWESISPMSSVRYTVAFTVLNQKLYAIGGVLNGVSLASVEIFDPTSETWSVGVELPAGVNRCEAITVNGKVYVVGGWDPNSQNTNKVYCFDPSTNIWSSKQDMPTARHGHQLVWFEDRIWAIGGSNGSSNLRKVESFNPVTNTWREEASLEVARHWPTAWVAENRVYVGGGWNPWLDSIESYNPNSSTWELSDTLPENKGFSGSVVADGKLYLASGQNGSGLMSEKLHVADLNTSISGVFDLYRKDGEVSAGSPMVQTEVVDGSISTSKISDGAVTSSKIAGRSVSPNQLSEQILKYLKPEIMEQPEELFVFSDFNSSLTVKAEGKHLGFQWKYNGSELSGANNQVLQIVEANKSIHEGNYSVVVANDFGSVESEPIKLVVYQSEYWDRSLGGTAGDLGRDVVVTDDLSLLIGGSSPSGTNGNKTAANLGLSDYWIVKVDPLGNKVWEKTYGGSLNDNLNVILKCDDGGFLLGGTSESLPSGNKQAASYGGNDIWLVRVDENGEKLWDRSYGGAISDSFGSLATDPLTGDILVVGSSDSNASFSKSDDSRGLADIWVLRINPQGKVIWDKTIGGSGSDSGVKIIYAGNGCFLIGGNSNSPAGFEKTQASRGGSDFWVVKIDGSGQIIWDRRFGSTYEDQCLSMVLTPEGDFLVGGTCWGNGDNTGTKFGNRDLWLLKLNQTGSLLWNKSYGGNSNEYCRDIIEDGNGGFLLIGSSDSSNISDSGGINPDYNDMWIINIDSNGTTLWNRFHGGDNQHDVAMSGVLYPAGGFVFFGYSNSSSTGTKSSGRLGGYDFWLIKANSAGTKN